MKICPGKDAACAEPLRMFAAPAGSVGAAVTLVTEWGLAWLRPLETSIVPVVAQIGLAGAQRRWYNVDGEASAPPPCGRPLREGERPEGRVLRV
jgi:hypothetical protein